MSDSQPSAISSQPSMGDAVKKYAPLALGAAAAAGAAAGVDLPPWAIDMLKQWGPAGILIIGVAYYVPRTSIRDFIQAQKDQAVALTSLADSVKNLPQKDEMQFKEILIGQEMLHRSVERLHARFDEIAQKTNGTN